MSSKLLGQVWDYQFTKAEQSVMLAMADHAKEDGSDCYPSVERIAWKTDYSERQVQRVLQDLTRRGILIVVRKPGRNRPTEYRIDLAKATIKPAFKPRKDDMVSGYRIKDDMVSSQRRSKKHDMVSGYQPKDDIVSPHRDAIAGHLGPNGTTFGGLKDDIAMSPEPLTLNPKADDQYHTDSWLRCVAELAATLTAGFVPTLTESQCEAAGEKVDPQDGKMKPFYRIIVPATHAKSIDHFAHQCGFTIRRKLGSVLGKPVLIEIVAAEGEVEPSA